MAHLHERFSLLDQIPLGICVLQSDYSVLFWNRRLEEWTKISREQIKGKSVCAFFPRFAEARYINRLAPIFTGGPPTIFSSQLHNYLIPVTLSDGKKCIQHTTVTAIPADEGGEFYAMLSIQDVTDLTSQVQQYRHMRDRAVAEAEERKRAQERAEAANRVKDEFLAIVSHELRTPLNPILGWSQLLLDSKLTGTAVQRALETISRNAALQAQLIDDLLDVSRILRGKLTLHFQTIDLVSVIHSALDTVRLMAESKSITVTFQHDAAAPVWGDAMRLQQVVWNLLSNSIKFTPEGGRVDILLRYGKKKTFLSIQDTGEGIASDFLPFVFESFRQADVSTTRRVGGLGLGLAITRNLVELHGGTIEVQSSGAGQGATFAVTLPSSQQDNQYNAQFSVAKADRSNLDGVKVLIVDDEPDSRDLFQFMLESSGATVKAVASVAAAIDALKQEKPDLIVSDLGMPDADGFELIEWIRSQPSDAFRDLPVIAVTAYASELTQQQTVLAGFQQRLVKPVNPDELIQVVGQFVAGNFSSLASHPLKYKLH